MSTQPNEAGAYVPRPGERVTVRRYIAPTTGERTLDSEHTGIATEVSPGDSTGYYLMLDSYPDRIFTGYQFLGAGADGRSPASLVTEVTPAKATFSRQVSPELVVGTDGSQCIVLLVGGTGPKDPIRKVTVTDVDALKAALDDARTYQRIALDEADAVRPRGPEGKRRAEGKFTKWEVVEHLAELTHRQRGHVIAVVNRARAHPELGPERLRAAGSDDAEFLVSWEADGYWRCRSLPNNLRSDGRAGVLRRAATIGCRSLPVGGSNGG